jgi:hypothetical protein
MAYALLHFLFYFILCLQKSLNSKSLKEVELLVQCLIIICRNFDNIPFIASCNYVSQTVGIAATVIHQVLIPQHVYFIGIKYGIGM